MVDFFVQDTTAKNILPTSEFALQHEAISMKPKHDHIPKIHVM